MYAPGFLEKEEGVHTVGPAAYTPETTRITEKLVASVSSCHSIIVSSMCECLRKTESNPHGPHVIHKLGLAASARLDPPPRRTVSCACAAGSFPKEPASWAPPRALILSSLLDTKASAAGGEGLPLMNSLILYRTVSGEGLVCLWMRPGKPGSGPALPCLSAAPFSGQQEVSPFFSLPPNQPLHRFPRVHLLPQPTGGKSA